MVTILLPSTTAWASAGFWTAERARRNAEALDMLPRPVRGGCTGRR